MPEPNAKVPQRGRKKYRKGRQESRRRWQGGGLRACERAQLAVHDPNNNCVYNMLTLPKLSTRTLENPAAFSLSELELVHTAVELRWKVVDVDEGPQPTRRRLLGSG